MNPNQTKVKAIIVSAILVVVVLLIVSVCELISISKMKEKVEKQNKKIDELSRQIEYYQNYSTDNKDFNNIIAEGD